MRKTTGLILTSFMMLVGCNQTAGDYGLKAFESLRREQYTLAIYRFNKCLSLNPYLPEAYVGRGIVRYKSGNYTGAIIDLTEGIELKTNLAEMAYCYRGLAKGKLEDHTGEILDYNSAIEINPKYVDAYYARGSIFYDQGRFHEALDDFNTTILLDSTYYKAFYERGLTRVILDDNFGGISDFTVSLTHTLDPKIRSVFFCVRGQAKANLQDFHSAIEDYTEAIELNPKYGEAYFCRGESRCELEDYAGALEDYTMTIMLDSTLLSDAYFGRGFVKGELRNDIGAIDDYSMAVRYDNEYIEAYIHRAMAKMRQKDNGGALVDLNKAIELDSTDGSTYLIRSHLKYTNKDFKGSKADLSKAIELDPDLVGADEEW